MTSEHEPSRDLATVVVPQIGRLVDTGDRWEPHRLVGPNGVAVEAVSAWFADLQAAGAAWFGAEAQVELPQPGASATSAATPVARASLGALGKRQDM